MLFGVTNSLSMFQLPKEEHRLIVEENVNKFGIAHLLNKKWIKLVVEEKQIIMICRAFIQGSNIIVLDEPLSALDFSNQNIILKLLKNIKNENKTIIFTTHNPNHALYLDANVLMIDNNELFIDGLARKELTINNLTKVYGDTIGFSKEHSYAEYSIKNDEV